MHMSYVRKRSAVVIIQNWSIEQVLCPLNLTIIDDGLNYGLTRLISAAICSEEDYRSSTSGLVMHGYFRRSAIDYIGMVPLAKVVNPDRFAIADEQVTRLFLKEPIRLFGNGSSSFFLGNKHQTTKIKSNQQANMYAFQFYHVNFIKPAVFDSKLHTYKLSHENITRRFTAHFTIEPIESSACVDANFLSDLLGDLKAHQFEARKRFIHHQFLHEAIFQKIPCTNMYGTLSFSSWC